MIFETATYAAIMCANISSRGTSDTARFIREEQEKGCSRIDSAISLRSGTKEAMYDLNSIAAESGGANWAGYESAPVAADTIEQAKRFIRALPLGIAAPSVGAEPDGHVTLEWYRSPKYVLSVSITPDGYLHYAALLGLSKSYGTELFLGVVPQSILSLISRVQSSLLAGAA